MASQLATNIRCQTLMHCTASYGERGSSSGHCTLSHRQSYGYHRIRNHSSGTTPQDFEGSNNLKEHNNMARDKGAKLSTKLGRQQAQKLHRLGFSYLASSLLYIVTKVKAFYNGFLGDVEPRMVMEAPMAPEAYFSVPVLPN